MINPRGGRFFSLKASLKTGKFYRPINQRPTTNLTLACWLALLERLMTLISSFLGGLVKLISHWYGVPRVTMNAPILDVRN